MAESFLGEIRMFAGNYSPAQWSYCYGTIMAISQATALYSLLGTAYGGDGRTSFGLPDMRGRIPVGSGNGPGLTPRLVGQRFGLERVTLDISTMPAHTHTLQGSGSSAITGDPIGRVPANVGDGNIFYDTNFATTSDYPEEVGNAGSGEEHNNIMPSLVISFIISMMGTYPSRN